MNVPPLCSGEARNLPPGPAIEAPTSSRASQETGELG